MSMPKMVQECSQGEDIRSLRKFVLSRKWVAGVCVLLRHGFHLDATIRSIQLALQIANLRNHLGSDKDITDMNVAVDETLFVQVDQAANDLLSDSHFLVLCQLDRPFDHMEQFSSFAVLEE
jgi:hypothetical protein